MQIQTKELDLSFYKREKGKMITHLLARKFFWTQMAMDLKLIRTYTTLDPSQKPDVHRWWKHTMQWSRSWWRTDSIKNPLLKNISTKISNQCLNNLYLVMIAHATALSHEGRRWSTSKPLDLSCLHPACQPWFKLAVSAADLASTVPNRYQSRGPDSGKTHKTLHRWLKKCWKNHNK